MADSEQFKAYCYDKCLINITANYSLFCTEYDYVDCAKYPKRIMDLVYLVPVTIVLILILLSGLFGNFSVCTVILKHPNMRSETNVYLFSLAVSDILLLIFGLVPELWYYWQLYPYVFGDFLCRFNNMMAATGTYASALTVVAFSIERYAAICLQYRFRSRGKSRLLVPLIVIWTISIAVAMPILHVYHVVVDDGLIYPGTGKSSFYSRTCTKPDEPEYEYYKSIYVVSSVIFFFLPMAVLLLIYIKIALYIRTNRQLARRSGIKNNCSENAKIFSLLVAVVVAFFVCGAPLHYQRIYNQLNSEKQEINRTVLVVTALFYYTSATINPILYNLMSKRYRTAFKEIIKFRVKPEKNVKMNVLTADTKRSSTKFTNSAN